MLLLGVIAGVLVSGGDDDDPEVAQIATTQPVGSGEIFLESAADAGPNPFTSPVAAPPPAVTAAPATSVPFTVPVPQTTTTLPSGTAPPRAVPAVAGGTPGLYGGTRNNSSCDQRQMITFLAANPSLARAWAGVHGITTAEVSTYINGLTPLVLRADTRVTNHGFEAGVATPRQSVLEAGTAVLIDQYGIPRARCYCGNPLLEPRAVPSTPTYTGRRWPRFDPGSVVVINQNTTIIQTITVIDLGTGQAFGRPIGTSGAQDGPAPGTPTTTAPTTTPTTAPPATAPAVTAPPATAPPATRPPATAPPATAPPATAPTLTIPPDVQAGSGDVQFTLLWQSDADLDLHVIEPGGNEVNFENPSSSTGGSLDVDNVPGCGTGSGSTHVENIFWPTGSAPGGAYTVYVKNFDGCSGDGSFQLRITDRGRVVYNSGGSAAPGGESSPVQINH